jgi:hypothetical protein
VQGSSGGLWTSALHTDHGRVVSARNNPFQAGTLPQAPADLWPQLSPLPSAPAADGTGVASTVSDIEHIESQSMPGVAVIKVFFQPGARIEAAVGQLTSIT